MYSSFHCEKWQIRGLPYGVASTHLFISQVCCTVNFLCVHILMSYQTSTLLFFFEKPCNTRWFASNVLFLLSILTIGHEPQHVHPPWQLCRVIGFTFVQMLSGVQEVNTLKVVHDLSKKRSESINSKNSTQMHASFTLSPHINYVTPPIILLSILITCHLWNP